MAGTKYAFLGSTHIFAGTHYGPGPRVEVPEQMIVHDGHVLGDGAAVEVLQAQDDPSGSETTNTGAGDEGADTDPDETPLPDDFPGREELAAAGVRSIEAVLELSDELEQINGIGPATARDISEALEAHLAPGAE